MLNIKSKNRGKQQYLHDFIPWSCLVSSEVIMQKDCIFQSTFLVCPMNLSYCTHEQVNGIVAAINNVMMRFGLGWSVFFESRREKVKLEFQDDWNVSIAKKMEYERKKYFESNPLYCMEYYVTVCYQQQNSKKMMQFFHTDTFSLEDALQNFLKYLYEIKSLLQECFSQVTLLKDTSLLTYIHSCISNTNHTVLVPPNGIDIDEYLVDESINIEEDFLIGDMLYSVISINDFPHFTHANILDDLQILDIDFRWQQRFIFMDEEHTLAKIKQVRRKYYAQRKSTMQVMQEQQSGEGALENTEAVTKAMNADEALQLLGEGTVHFGLLTSVVIIKARQKEELDRKIDLIKKTFQKKGFIVREESINIMEAWLSSLPGQVYANVRKFLIHTVNFAHLLPLSSRWNGNRYNDFMQKISGNSNAHIIANSQQNVFYFNLNIQDVGHSLIVGPTGAGKSTLLSMLALQFLRYKYAQVIIFDKDFSSFQVSKNVEGETYVPGSKNNTMSFQPFCHMDIAKERNWGLQFCEQLLFVNNHEVSVNEIDDLKRSLEILGTVDRKQRTMSTFRDLLQFSSVKKIFEKYTKDGIYGTVFDGVIDKEYNARWLFIEMSLLMDMGEKVLIPSLLYLFYSIEMYFDGHPTLLIIDEGWLFLKNKYFAERFRTWLKTLRKKHVFVILATQELADIVNYQFIDTIMSACHVRIFLPDISATNNQMRGMYTKFGLNETEIDIIAGAIPKKEYFMCASNKRALFSLDINDNMLNLLSSPTNI